MLVLTRKLQEQIVIGENIVVTVVKIDRNQIRLGIDAPAKVRVLRDELKTRAAAPNRRTVIAPGTIVYWWHDRGKTLRAGSFAKYTSGNAARVYNVFKLRGALVTPKTKDDWVEVQNRDGDPETVISVPIFSSLKEARDNRPQPR
jgi:carbon storage regulator